MTVNEKEKVRETPKALKRKPLNEKEMKMLDMFAKYGKIRYIKISGSSEGFFPQDLMK